MMSRTRAFFCGFSLTAAVLVPLIGCILLLQRTTAPSASQAGAQAEGVPVALPGPQDAMTLLLAVQSDAQPSFLLLRLDGAANRLAVVGLAPQTVLRAPEGGTVLLEQAFADAGPARAAALTADTLSIPIDHYLAVNGKDLTAACEKFGAATVNLSGFDLPEAQTQVGQAPTRTLLPAQVGQALAEWRLAADQQARLLATITAEFLASAIQTDPTLPAQALRTLSSRMASDLDGNDIAQIERICGFLARGQAQPQADGLPGYMRTGRFELDPAAPETAAQLLGTASRIPESGSALPGTAGPSSAS